MKEMWTEPRIEVQKFAANEYVAACGDSGTVYYFKCDAGDRRGGYSVYLNGEDGIPHTRDDIFWCGDWDAVRGIRTYTRCGETHKAEDNNDFYPGYIQRGRTEQNVIVWTANGTNTHCTTDLNMDHWVTAKS
jgi:hypothetical protein